MEEGEKKGIAFDDDGELYIASRKHDKEEGEDDSKEGVSPSFPFFSHRTDPCTRVSISIQTLPWILTFPVSQSSIHEEDCQ